MKATSELEAIMRQRRRRCEDVLPDFQRPVSPRRLRQLQQQQQQQLQQQQEQQQQEQQRSDNAQQLTGAPTQSSEEMQRRPFYASGSNLELVKAALINPPPPPPTARRTRTSRPARAHQQDHVATSAAQSALDYSDKPLLRTTDTVNDELRVDGSSRNSDSDPAPPNAPHDNSSLDAPSDPKPSLSDATSASPDITHAFADWIPSSHLITQPAAADNVSSDHTWTWEHDFKDNLQHDTATFIPGLLSDPPASAVTEFEDNPNASPPENQNLAPSFTTNLDFPPPEHHQPDHHEDNRPQADSNQSRPSDSPYQDALPEPAPPVSAKTKVTLRSWNLLSATKAATSNATPPPVVNPLTGNIILCQQRSNGAFILEELDPPSKKHCVTVASTPILTIDMRKRISLQHGRSPLGVTSVSAIAAGVHKQQGRSRVRLAAIIDFVVVSLPPTASDDATSGQLNKQIERFVAVYQWGYAPNHPIALQSVIAAPSLPREYDPSTFCVADGLLFLGGTRTPSVYVAKPHVRDAWSTNLLYAAPNSAAHITALAVTTHPLRSYKYLSVALSDGRISVWTYELAVTTNRLTEGGPQQQVLQPFCRLQGASSLKRLEDTLLMPQEGDERENNGDSQSFGSRVEKMINETAPSNAMKPELKEEINSYCTHLSWLPPGPCTPSILFLAAAFTNGVAVYHVSLPIVLDLALPAATSVSELSITSDEPSSKAKTPLQKAASSLMPKSPFLSLAETVAIRPFVAAKAQTQGLYTDGTGRECTPGRARVRWLDFGPRSPHGLALLFESTIAGEETSYSSRVVLGALDLPLYGSRDAMTDDGQPRKLLLLCEEYVAPRFPSSQTDIIGVNAIEAIVCHCNGNLTAFFPACVAANEVRGAPGPPPPPTDDACFSALSRPVASNSLGLDSHGFVLCDNDQDDVLHVFTVTQCKRQTLADISSTIKMRRRDWTTPVQRHWLCRTVVGDRKVVNKTEHVSHPSDNQSAPPFGEDDVPTGGAQTAVVCELTCGNDLFNVLSPYAIKRAKGTNICAILFATAFVDKKVSVDPIAFAILDSSVKNTGETFTLHHGRDVAFLPSQVGLSSKWSEKILVLDVDGTSLYEMQSGATQTSSTLFNASDWTRGNTVRILEADQTLIRRIFVLTSGCILHLGTRPTDGRNCIFFGGHVDSAESDSVSSSIMPRGEIESKLWLKEKEDLVSLIELPHHEGDQDFNLGLATNFRVLIISGSTLCILAETAARPTCNSLSALGSHCVSFCTFLDSLGGGAKVKYLSCLIGCGSQGVIMTLPCPRHGHAPYLLLAIRPDRIVYVHTHHSTRLVEHGDDDCKFLLPLCTTRPAFLLEPMVACVLSRSAGTDRAMDESEQGLLRTILERFGRKTGSFPHGENEGIGSLGTGITDAIYEMLRVHGYSQPGSILLTGHSTDDKGASSKILPPWTPMLAKAKATRSCNNALEILASGDLYLSDYVKSPENALASVLPRCTDSSATISHMLALSALEDSNALDALKFLDLAGSQASERDLVHVVLSLQLEKKFKINGVLSNLCGGGGLNSGLGDIKDFCSTSSSIAALALDLKKRQVGGKVPLEEGECSKMSEAMTKRWIRQLSPSVQRGLYTNRGRSRLLGNLTPDVVVTAKNESKESERLWRRPVDDTKHVWRKGPFEDKEEILLLDRMEEWLGRRRPTILGKEGAEAAAESGEKTLADILAKAARDLDGDHGQGSVDDDDSASFKEGWTDGVGEGRTDEENLAVYFRFSEGADEDNHWRSDGISDLTIYQHKALILGSESTSMNATTSNVDEGESGKVKLLHDLVYNESVEHDRAVGMLVEVKRGSSLDVGMLHNSDHESRQRCTLEFWYHLPKSDHVVSEIVLARRSILFPGEDISQLCIAAEKDGLLWELVVLPTGRLEFRSSGGSILSSLPEEKEPSKSPSALSIVNQAQVHDDIDKGLVSWQNDEGFGGWNHVCLTFSCRLLESFTKCSVTMMMKGVTVTSSVVSIEPPGLEPDQLSDIDEISEALEKTALAFGLAAPSGFRITEVRAWTCERDEDDVKSMMYEYLHAAETKKKFKVKIRSKRGTAAAANTSTSLLAPPKSNSTIRLPQPDEPKTSLPASSVASRRRIRGATVEQNATDTEINNHNFEFDVSFDSVVGAAASVEKSNTDEDTNRIHVKSPDKGENTAADSAILVAGTDGFQTHAFDVDNDTNVIDFSTTNANDVFGTGFPPVDQKPLVSPSDEGSATSSVFSLTYKEAVPLSKQVRNSAAAAIVRGPPATRHFGGNRGGLRKSPNIDFIYNKSRNGVGSIAICGAEKTVIYTHDQSPPGKTYPIGASGAIISDIMDSSGSEYLCCFLAKDKRMVVFELHSKTIVVELQMTTKLNFWRYLPPTAHGYTLVFMLITPVGGFHWMPLDESPRPRQTWKRGPELQGKKIVAYEEGGFNGAPGQGARSTVALLLTSTATAGAPVEAWCLPMFGDSSGLCLSTDVMGAALFRPTFVGKKMTEFDPLVITASLDVKSNGVLIEVTNISKDAKTGSLSRGPVVASATLQNVLSPKVEITEPTMAMGTSPSALCLCCEGHIVVIDRSRGMIAAFRHTKDSLKLVGQKSMGRYVVDAGIRTGDVDGEVEVVLLMCEPDNLKDGRVGTVHVTQHRGII